MRRGVEAGDTNLGDPGVLSLKTQAGMGSLWDMGQARRVDVGSALRNSRC